MEKNNLNVDSIIDNIRIDKFLSICCNLSRQIIKKMIKNGEILVNKRKVKKGSFLVQSKDNICIQKSLFKENSPPLINVEYKAKTHIKTPDWNIPILFEDSELLIVNKPHGLIVHPGQNIKEITLTDIIQATSIPLSTSSDTNRSGIVHRIDQYTEGILIITKTNSSMTSIQKQFKSRSIKKKYYAVLLGVLKKEEGEINASIGRDQSIRIRKSCTNIVKGTEKTAITKYTVLNKLTNLSLIDVDLITGRTHQIRVHFSSINFPVLGDSLYSKQNQRKDGYLLQSYYVKFKHPIKKTTIEVSIPISQRLKKYAKKTNNN